MAYCVAGIGHGALSGIGLDHCTLNAQRCTLNARVACRAADYSTLNAPVAAAGSSPSADSQWISTRIKATPHAR